MPGTTPDLVLRLYEDVLAATVLDQENPSDRFVPIYLGDEALESVDLDRRFALVLEEGPDFVGSSSCMEGMVVTGTWRYYTARDSRSRMVRDVRKIRKVTRGLRNASTTGLAPEVAAAQQYIKPPRIEGIVYDYLRVLGLTLVSVRVAFEYHIDVTEV